MDSLGETGAKESWVSTEGKCIQTQESVRLYALVNPQVNCRQVLDSYQEETKSTKTNINKGFKEK